MPKKRRPQQGRQPSKERENFRKKIKPIKLSSNNKKFDKSKLKVKKKKKKL